jgi:hypothetical protein
MICINFKNPKFTHRKATSTHVIKIFAATLPTRAHEALTSFILTLALAVLTLTMTLPHAHAGDRGKVIDFEEATVEGLNKRPYDSLQALNEKERRKKRAHLYRRRGSFQSEIVESLRERIWEYDGS